MIKTVIDSNRNSYKVAKQLGAGSQGTTYLLENGKHIAKLFNQNFNSTEIKSKINFLIQLGLDKEYFAVPLREITQPKIGYIAEFASGMISLEELKWKNRRNNLGEWYKETGGLQKRYDVLIKLAHVLRKLHSKGLAYCDLSPNNVFISEKPNLNNVFLIDLDNLRYKTSIIHNIWTPFYGAPEVITSNAPNTTMSDSFSFAVIAYELLTLNHPLIGDYITNGEPDLEDQALQGKIPWVDNEIDTRNKRSTGLPTKSVIPERLLKLFRKTFEEGLNDPMERPSMAEWFDVLNLANNELLNCGNQKCGFTFPFNENKECPLCGYTPNKVIRIKIRRWEEIEEYDKNDKTTNTLKKFFELQEEPLEEILLDNNTPKEIILLHFLLPDTDILKPLLKIELLKENNNKVLLNPQNNNSFKLSNRLGTPHKRPNSTTQTLIDKPQIINIVDSSQPNKQKYMLHLQDLTISQRVLTID